MPATGSLTLRFRASLAAFLLLLVDAAPAGAQEVAVDLEMVLAVDVSGSVSRTEVDLQRAGYLEALRDPRVARAIGSGPLGRIALAYVEWSDSQRVTVDWTLVSNAADARAFAAALDAAAVPTGRTTAIAAALDFSTAFFDGNGFSGTRRVIDLSADGRDTDYLYSVVAEARDRALARGVVINGLAINPARERLLIKGIGPDLEAYFRAFVIGGPGAFLAVAERPRDFRPTLLRKLIREIAVVPDAVVHSPMRM